MGSEIFSGDDGGLGQVAGSYITSTLATLVFEWFDMSPKIA